MGIVYRAVHERSGQVVALKVLSSFHEAWMPLVRREIRAMTRLRHPNIVRIVAHGTVKGTPWMAMELGRGKTLRDGFLRGSPEAMSTSTDAVPRQGVGIGSFRRSPRAAGSSGAPPPREARAAALAVVRRLCAPLAYLHGEGFVHRDLKPDNILVDNRGEPLLVDLGLVAEFAGAVGREPLFVDAGAMGTILYMAPEQIRGELVDARTDLYALGCILYELLTGHVPFPGASTGAVLRGHLSQAPVAPSRCADGLPPALDDLVLRLLAKAPGERLGYADDVARVLAAVSSGGPSPVRAAPLARSPQGPRASERQRLPRHRPYLYRPRFVGRADLLSSCRAGLEALRGGQGGLLLMAGESGIGKTRLLIEVAREAARSARSAAVRVLSGTCSAPGIAPLLASAVWTSTEEGPLAPATAAAAGERPALLQALQRPLQEIADWCREHGHEETDRVLGQNGKVLSAFAPALSTLPGQEAYPAPAPLVPEAAVQRLFKALADMLVALARGAPILLMLDDLQWADELTVGFLRHFARLSADARPAVLVVGAYRSEEAGALLDTLIEEPEAMRLHLPRLDRPVLGMLVGDMLAMASPPGGLIEFLGRWAAGNPFFVTQYLQAAIERGLLRRDELGSWQVDAAVAPGEPFAATVLPLPRTIGSLVSMRLRRLSPAAVAVAGAAAVVGRASPRALVRIVTKLPDGKWLDAVDDLVRREVLEEDPAQFPELQGALCFTHDKLREVAYAEIAPAARTLLHRATAEAMEALGLTRLDEHLVDLARHWHGAGVADKARAAFLEAARSARSRHALREAEQRYRVYLTTLARPTIEGVQVRAELAFDVLLLGARHDAAETEFRRTLEDARMLGDATGEALGQRGLGIVLRNTGRLAEARRACEEAVGCAQRSGDRNVEALALLSLASIASDQGAHAEGGTLLERALAIHRGLGRRDLIGTTLSRLATSFADRDQKDVAVALYEEALAIHRAENDRRSAARTLSNLACAYWDGHRLDRALPLWEEALAICRETGDRLLEAVTMGNLAHLHAHLPGGLPLADHLNAEALAIFREIGDLRDEAVILLDMAVVERRVRGDLERAEACLAGAEGVAQRLGSKVLTASCAAQRGHVALAVGAAARPFLAAAERITRELGESHTGEPVPAMRRLVRAIEAAEAGLPLFCGECPNEVPEVLRRTCALPPLAGETEGEIRSGATTRSHPLSECRDDRR